jgi:predicted nucleic acid-binding protein
MSTRSIEEVPTGQRVFLDATVFVYHFAGQSQQCRRLLERCERHEVLGVTSAVAFNEACHRLMIFEALHSGAVTGRDVPRKLREHPDLVKRLRRHGEQLRHIVSWGIEILPVDAARCLRAADLRATTGLLTNDSIILATMRDERIGAIATADSDFGDLEGVTAFRPSDLGNRHPPLA